MEINKKQIGTIVTAFIFIFSGLSFALNLGTTSSNVSKEETSSGLVRQPIADEQRKIFISNDITILTLFYTKEDEESQKVKENAEKLNNDIGEKLLLEEIDVRTYQSFSAEYNVHGVPTILIRGKSNINAPLRLEGPQDYETLEEKICSTYETKPEICG